MKEELRTYAGDEYATRFDVQVHKVERNATLKITVYPTDSNLISNIGDPQVG